MAAREEVKAQLYNIFYEEEKGFSAKPDIRCTRDYAKEGKAHIHFTVVSKIFPERTGYRRLKAIVAVIICTILILLLLLDSNESFLLDIVLSAIIVVMIFGLTSEQVNKIIVAGRDIEISSDGIDLKGRNLTWSQIMGTYILLRRCRMQLVLLLDNGEILKQDLARYGKFSFLRSRQIAGLCCYIEHFKGKVASW